MFIHWNWIFNQGSGKWLKWPCELCWKIQWRLVVQENCQFWMWHLFLEFWHSKVGWRHWIQCSCICNVSRKMMLIRGGSSQKIPSSSRARARGLRAEPSWEFFEPENPELEPSSSQKPSSRAELGIFRAEPSFEPENVKYFCQIISVFPSNPIAWLP